MQTQKLTISQALRYLKSQRGISVSRQALHLYVRRKKNECEQIAEPGRKVVLWLVPVTLLDSYAPSSQNQEAGITAGESRKNRRKK